MPDLDSNGVHLYYEDSGSGLPLLLSHSWFCNAQQWPASSRLLPVATETVERRHRHRDRWCSKGHWSGANGVSHGVSGQGSTAHG